MTYYKCLNKCGKNCEKFCKELCDHTNKNCHLKKCCCYARDSSRSREESSVESKVCETCCCLVKKCKCRSPERRNKSRVRYTSQSRRDKLREQRTCEICCCVVTKCTCRQKSPFKCLEKKRDKKICQFCCCLLINCTCKKPSDLCRPRILCEDLPLYDEKSHLIGYIKKGSIIDDPSCERSYDKQLEESSAEGHESRPRLTTDLGCMASCRYAEGVRRHARTKASPRWTTRSSFDHATRSQGGDTTSKSRRCPCK